MLKSLQMFLSARSLTGITFASIGSVVIVFRVGYSLPLFAGFVIIIISSLMFAFSTTYWMLIAARALNGVGSGFSATSGLGFLAQTFTDNVDRGRAISFCFGGVAIGILAGPVVGGLLYRLGGMVLPFVCLAAIALSEGGKRIYIVINFSSCSSYFTAPKKG